MIETRCYPWKAPNVSPNGKVRLKSQPKHYQHWKSWSADVSMVLMARYRYEVGYCVDDRVDVDLLFVADPELKQADRTNLGKAFEDILQGLIYLNDSQIEGGDIRRVFIGEPVVPAGPLLWEGPERVHFRVTLLQ